MATSTPRLALAHRFPDIPRWIEIRDYLLGGTYTLLGLDDGAGLSFLLRDETSGSLFIVGRPAPEAVHAAIDGSMTGEIVAPQEETAAWLATLLPDWTPKPIILHLLQDRHHLPADTGGRVRFLDPSTIAGLRAPEKLRRELEGAAEDSPIAATFVDDEPVSFCYAGFRTETLWDVSIDTLEGHRGRGHAGLCAAHMIRYMWGLGKEPVWGALEENPASWRLARRLGFVAMDRITIFERSSSIGG